VDGTRLCVGWLLSQLASALIYLDTCRPCRFCIPLLYIIPSLKSYAALTSSVTVGLLLNLYYPLLKVCWSPLIFLLKLLLKHALLGSCTVPEGPTVPFTPLGPEGPTRAEEAEHE
jgi:hypothetical protein